MQNKSTDEHLCGGRGGGDGALRSCDNGDGGGEKKGGVTRQSEGSTVDVGGTMVM